MKRNQMIDIARRVIQEDRGSVSAMSTIFLTVILALGAIVGLTIVRDHMMQEFGDLGVSLDNLDQSFSYQIMVCGELCTSARYRDNSATLQDNENQAPACLMLGQPASSENGSLPAPSGQFP